MIPLVVRTLLAVSLVSGLTACGNSSSSAGPTPKESNSSPVVERSLQIQEAGRASIDLPTGWTPALLEGGEKGVAILENAATNNRNRLLFVGVASEKVQSVSTPRDGWRITNFTASGNWVAWSEQHGDPIDPMTPVEWRVKCYDVDTKETLTLLKSSAATPLTPGVQLSHRNLFLSTYNGVGRGTFDFSEIRLPSKTRTTLFTNVAGGQIAYDGRHLFSTLTEKRGSQAGDSASDVFELRHSGNRQLSHSGRGAAPDYAFGHLMWVSKNAVEVARSPSYTKVAIVARHSDPFPSLGSGLFSDMLPRHGHYQARVSALADPTVGIWLHPEHRKYLAGIPAMYGRRVYWTVAPSGFHGRNVVLHISHIGIR